MYDLIIIGAGTAGFNAYKQALKSTKNLLIINDGTWATTCANVGCMPSKVLISSGNRLHDAHTAAQVGLDLAVKADTQNVMSHLRRLRDYFSAAMIKDAESWNKKHKISGSARFVAADTVEVNGKRYQAKSFILAVGSTPNIETEWQNELKERLLTTDSIFELPRVPKRLTVIGSGAIGIELAQAFSRLGCKVTVLARRRNIGSFTSSDLQNLAIEALNQEIDFKFNSEVDKVKRNEKNVTLSYTTTKGDQKTQHTVSSDYVLMAIGRRSLLSSLDLDKIDKKFKDMQQLPINTKTKQLGNYPIFVVGDAFTDTPIQHEAAYAGRAVVANALNYPKVKAIKPLTPLNIVFSEPEMAMVGKTKQALMDKKIDFVVGRASYEDQGRARVLGKNQGAIELYVERKGGRLLGAELFCFDAEHLAHLLAWTMDDKITIEQLLAKPFYHPTLQEGLRTAARNAAKQLQSNPKALH